MQIDRQHPHPILGAIFTFVLELDCPVDSDHFDALCRRLFGSGNGAFFRHIRVGVYPELLRQLLLDSACASLRAALSGE
jgi:hypothetical protein